MTHPWSIQNRCMSKEGIAHYHQMRHFAIQSHQYLVRGKEILPRCLFHSLAVHWAGECLLFSLCFWRILLSIYSVLWMVFTDEDHEQVPNQNRSVGPWLRSKKNISCDFFLVYTKFCAWNIFWSCINSLCRKWLLFYF